MSLFDLGVVFDRTVRRFLYLNADVNVEGTQKD